MKDRPIIYAGHQYASTSEPQYVISIEFAPASFEYFASHAGIADIPGGTIESVIEDFSSVSQSFDPETGASRIGSLTVQLGDLAGAVTDAFQARLLAGTGVRDKQLRLYKGFAGLSWNDFELKWTQDVHEVSEDHARYKISCSDLQRAMRTEIFELKTTILDATLSATASVATVADTSEFILVEHGTSYSHGPSATWGYFKLDDEIIGYTGKTGTTFTGLDRGLFNTLPAEHKVDGTDPPERRPEVEEYVYLEMPVPKLVKALLTGILHGQGGAELPAHWHMGIDIALIEDAQFTGIGPDLWDPANDAVGLPGHFTDIDSIDGKRFIESECFLLAQIFSPVLADGKLGLKRFTPALATAAHLVTLNESNVQKHSALKHSMREVFNRVVLNWSWISGSFRRQTIKLDTDSIAKHGQAPIKVYNFRGLAANIATQSVLDQRFDAIRDRFSAPPLSLSVDVSKSLDRMELGDVCLVQLPNVRDMAADTVNPIDRAFEIRQIREDRKRLTFVLSGSSAEAVPIAPIVNALPDAYYDQEGTELSTVVPITAGVTDAGTSTLVGDPLLANSVFYYIGNLTIAATTTLNIDDNVQLRVRGFLTINGVINGVARGLNGVVDGISTGDAPSGLAGFFGSTVGGDGASHDTEFDGYHSRKPTIVIAAPAAPHLNLDVVGNTLNGLPSQLRGCSGGPGGKLTNGFIGAQVGAGGTGGDGGSGLLIVCRGMSFGGGASIDLSGGDGASALQQTLGGRQFFGGGGGGGSPGAFYVLLDGNRLVPDVAPKFTALGGNTPIDGTPIPTFFTLGAVLGTPPFTGLKDDTRRLSDVAWSDGAFRVQFVPVPETPVEDLPDQDLTVYYILATNGNAIHNGTGTLTLEAHRLLAGSDELLSTGTIKLFDPADQELTVANGYVIGSDGYTGILDSGDIIGDIIITMKDGPTGTPLDTITLVDVADGATGPTGPDGADAVYGIVEPENGLAWTRATNSGPWTPAQATTDLDCTFFQGGVAVARIARRVTLNTTDGTFTAASIAHKGGDLNTARVNVTVISSGSTAISVQFDYSFGGEDASVAETVSSSQGGDDGATGADGADAVSGSIEPENGLAWTRARNRGDWTPAQLTTDLDCTFVQGGAAVARIARRITLTLGDGTLAATSTPHKDTDLNTGRVTVTVTGSASTSITVQFDYSFGGDDSSVAETVQSAQGGDHAFIYNSEAWVKPDVDPMGQWDLISGSLARTNMSTTLQGPFGEYPVSMRINGDGTAPGFYAQWRHPFDVDDDVSFIVFQWVRRRTSATDKGLYMGWHGTVQDSVTPFADSTNAYFVTNQGSIMTVLKWYLAVGVLLPSNFVAAKTGVGGLYDPDRGVQIYEGSEYRVKAGETLNYARHAFYSNTTAFATSDGFNFTRPVGYKRDGSEPTIEEVLNLAALSDIIESLTAERDMTGGGSTFTSGASPHDLLTISMVRLPRANDIVYANWHGKVDNQANGSTIRLRAEWSGGSEDGHSYTVPASVSWTPGLSFQHTFTTIPADTAFSIILELTVASGDTIFVDKTRMTAESFEAE